MRDRSVRCVIIYHTAEEEQASSPSCWHGQWLGDWNRTDLRPGALAFERRDTLSRENFHHAGWSASCSGWIAGQSLASLDRTKASHQPSRPARITEPLQMGPPECLPPEHRPADKQTGSSRAPTPGRWPSAVCKLRQRLRRCLNLHTALG